MPSVKGSINNSHQEMKKIIWFLLVFLWEDSSQFLFRHRGHISDCLLVLFSVSAKVKPSLWSPVSPRSDLCAFPSMYLKINYCGFILTLRALLHIASKRMTSTSNKGHLSTCLMRKCSGTKALFLKSRQKSDRSVFLLCSWFPIKHCSMISAF